MALGKRQACRAAVPPPGIQNTRRQRMPLSPFSSRKSWTWGWLGPNNATRQPIVLSSPKDKNMAAWSVPGAAHVGHEGDQRPNSRFHNSPSLDEDEGTAAARLEPPSELSSTPALVATWLFRDSSSIRTRLGHEARKGTHTVTDGTASSEADLEGGGAECPMISNSYPFQGSNLFSCRGPTVPMSLRAHIGWAKGLLPPSDVSRHG